MKKITLILALLLLFVLFYTFRIYKIDGTSMNYGLTDGDIVVTYRLFRQIRRGDLLVFDDPRPAHEALCIKRCAALPTDRFFQKNRSFYLQLEGDSNKTEAVGRTHDLQLVKTPHGYFLKDPYLKYYGIVHNRRLTVPEVLETLPLSTVPPKHCYMLGDYRDNSEDSRFYGAVPRRLIYSKVRFIFKRAKNWQTLINIQEADRAP